MAASVRISVDLEASQATQVAGKLSQVLAEASINGASVFVNPNPIGAANSAAVDLNQTLKEIQISV